MNARQAGFTLLELIVVMAIFAIFSLMAYGGLDTVLNTRRDIELAHENLSGYQRAFVKLRNDFQMASTRPIRDGFGDAAAALQLNESGYIEFTRGGWRNPLFQPRAMLERVAYRLENGALVRLGWRVLDRAQDSQPVQTELLKGIEELRWRVLDDQREWTERWPEDTSSGSDSQADAPLPRGVELRMLTKDLGELTFIFALGSETPDIKSLAPSFTYEPETNDTSGSSANGASDGDQ